MSILPFIATLSGMLMASGTGLLLAHNQSVSVSYDTDFTWLGQGDFLGFPVPAWIAAAAYVYGSIAAQLHELRPLRAGGRRQRGGGAADGPAGRPGEVLDLRAVGRVRQPRRRHPRGAVRRRPAGRGGRLGAVLDRRGRGRRHAADRRRRLGRRRRSPACCCSASSSTCSISRTASAGSASAPIGSRWCAASS